MSAQRAFGERARRTARGPRRRARATARRPLASSRSASAATSTASSASRHFDQPGEQAPPARFRQQLEDRARIDRRGRAPGTWINTRAASRSQRCSGPLGSTASAGALGGGRGARRPRGRRPRGGARSRCARSPHVLGATPIGERELRARARRARPHPRRARAAARPPRPRPTSPRASRDRARRAARSPPRAPAPARIDHRAQRVGALAREQAVGIVGGRQRRRAHARAPRAAGSRGCAPWRAGRRRRRRRATRPRACGAAAGARARA